MKHISKYRNPSKGQTPNLYFLIYENVNNTKTDKGLIQNIEAMHSTKYFKCRFISWQSAFFDNLVCERNGDPRKHFICFLPNPGHKFEQLAGVAFRTLKTYKQNIDNYRGQSYYNASNMYGSYKGLQLGIKACPRTVFVPCSTHSLHLIGAYAAEYCKQTTGFFGFQNLFVFLL